MTEWFLPQFFAVNNHCLLFDPHAHTILTHVECLLELLGFFLDDGSLRFGRLQSPARRCMIFWLFLDAAFTHQLLLWLIHSASSLSLKITLSSLT